MDVRMPHLDGVEATRQIVAVGSPARILVLTTYDLDEYVYAAIRAGASGFLLKDVQPAQLAEAIRVIAAGDALLAPSVTRRLLGQFARTLPGPRATPASLAALTERETEVLRLLAAGLSNAELAGRLYISEATVKSHVSSLPRQGTAQRDDPARVWPVCEMDVRDRSGYREDRLGGAAPHGYLDPASKSGTARRRWAMRRHWWQRSAQPSPDAVPAGQPAPET